MGLSFYRVQTEVAVRRKQSEETELWKYLHFKGLYYTVLITLTLII